MTPEELAKLRAQLNKQKALELEKVREENRREREQKKSDARHYMEMDRQAHKIDLAQLQSQLSPIEHEQIRRTEHFYGEKERDADHDRKKDLMMHAVECDVLKEKLLLQVRKKYGTNDVISDEEMSELVKMILSEEDV